MHMMRCSMYLLSLIVLIEQFSGSKGLPLLKNPIAKYRSPAADCEIGMLPELDESRMLAFWSRLGPLTLSQTVRNTIKNGPTKWENAEDVEFTKAITFKLFS